MKILKFVMDGWFKILQKWLIAVMIQGCVISLLGVGPKSIFIGFCITVAYLNLLNKLEDT